MINPSNSKFRILNAAIAAAIAIGPLAACQPLTDPSSDIESPTPEPISGLKIGVILPYTGNLAELGQSMIRVLPMIIDQANACGGVNGESISLVVEDDQSQPGVAATVMTKLIESDQVSAAVVGFVDPTVPMVLDIAVQNKVPVISPGSTSSVFTDKAKEGVFQGFWARTVPSDTNQAIALAQLAFERRIRRAATVVMNNDDGLSFEDAFITAFEERGGVVVNKESPTRYESDAENLYTAAVDAFAPYGNGPTAVVAALDQRGGVLLLKTAYEIGVSDGVQLLIADTIQPRSFLQSVGRTYDGRFILSGATGTIPGASGPALDNLTERWKNRDGKTPPVFVPQTWDAVALLILAAQAANSTNGAAIKEHLSSVANAPGIEVTNVCTGLKLLKEGQDIDYQGASSNVDLDENGDVIGNYDIWTVKETGEVEVVRQIKLD
ncbi:MAG: ABC transporter substrate-binding protein [Elainellaceae cyanobacterium]